MTQVPPGRLVPPVAPLVSQEGAEAPERRPQGQPAPATPLHGLPDDLHNALSLVIYKAGIPLSAASAAAEAIAARPALLDALVAYRQGQRAACECDVLGCMWCAIHGDTGYRPPTYGIDQDSEGGSDVD